MAVHILSLFDDDDFLPEKSNADAKKSIVINEEKTQESDKENADPKEIITTKIEAAPKENKLINIELPQVANDIEESKSQSDDLSILYKEAIILADYTQFSNVEHQLNDNNKEYINISDENSNEKIAENEIIETPINTISTINLDEKINVEEEILPTNSISSIVFDTSESIKPKREKTNDTEVTTLPEWDLVNKYYGIGEVAAMFGVNISHIRFWTNEFKIKIRTNKKGDRLYTPEHIERLRTIHYLVKVQKHTIQGAKEKLKNKNSAVTEEIALKDSLSLLKEQLLVIRNNL